MNADQERLLPTDSSPVQCLWWWQLLPEFTVILMTSLALAESPTLKATLTTRRVVSGSVSWLPGRRMVGELAWAHWTHSNRLNFIYALDQDMRI